MKKIMQKLTEIRDLLMKEENTWMWSLLAIFALIVTAFILLYYIAFYSN